MGEGQSELFVPRPERRLVVPAESCAWWGVDGSTQRVAIGTIWGNGRRGVSVAPFAAMTGLLRLPEIRQETHRLARELAEMAPPGFVYVEQPSGGGQAVNHELEFAVGVIAEALQDGVHAATGRWPQVEMTTSAHWKKVSCGNGGIRKTERVGSRTVPLPIAQYGVYQWAIAHGYPEIPADLQGTTRSVAADEVDAYAIAECARRDVELVLR